MKRYLFFILILTFLSFCAYSQAEELQWWKGNLHTHTWWSDGDCPPEMVIAWYKEHGYHFLALTDHNILATGDKWRHVKDNNPLQAFKTCQQQYGENWAAIRKDDGKLEVKLHTLQELCPKFEEKDRFILIKGEEITDQYKNLPVHLNAINFQSPIDPQKGGSVKSVIDNNVTAVVEQRIETGRPMIVQINHPNFGWGLTADDIIPVRYAKFMEIYNGHPSVHNYGDQDHIGVEAMWDRILAARLGKLSYGVVYGMADDDAHNYIEWGVGRANPGRAWIMVRAQELTSAALIEAIDRGDYYCSSGVFLKDVQRTGEELKVEVDPESNAEYTISFIGTRKNSDKTGEIFQESKGTSASYRFTGDELYVRAKIVSTIPHPNPFQERDVKTAWTQPLVNE